MQHSMKMMWGCVAVIVLVAVLAVTGSGAGRLLFALPCALMMGAMVWMMMRGMGGGSRGGEMLDRRLAAGEIDLDEYESARAAMSREGTGSRTGPPTPA
jgi:hypothetical protein